MTHNTKPWLFSDEDGNRHPEYYKDEIDEENLHKNICDRLNNYLTIVYNKKDTDHTYYFNYYLVICDIMKSGHSLCGICGDLETQATHNLSWIQCYYCPCMRKT